MGRAGVRGQYLKIKRLLTLSHSSIGHGGEVEKPNCPITPITHSLIFPTEHICLQIVPTGARQATGRIIFA
jgi:hypothetical protein